MSITAEIDQGTYTATSQTHLPHIVQVHDRLFVIRKYIKLHHNDCQVQSHWVDCGERRGWFSFHASYYSSIEEAETALKEAEYYTFMTDLASVG
jgi:hypothetical protein